MNKLIFVANGGDVMSRTVSAVKKLSKKQLKTNKVLSMVIIAMMLNDIIQTNFNRQVQGEIMMLKSEIEKLKQQNGD
ncbi:MAG: hypothetical protein IJ192_13745 [Clostridia bacterium]|nr:hypothetical protein [Clostridia bacterium]